jgi:hypothetical protein
MDIEQHLPAMRSLGAFAAGKLRRWLWLRYSALRGSRTVRYFPVVQ